MRHRQQRDDEPLYEIVGREPMSERKVRAAVTAWRADHPKASVTEAAAIEGYLRRLNDRAVQDAADAKAAEHAGTTIAALRRARAEAHDHAIRQRQQRDLEAARQAVGHSGPGVVRRTPGRPGWEHPTFFAAYREARDRAGGPTAKDQAIADQMGFRLQQLQRLVRRFGRPE